MYFPTEYMKKMSESKYYITIFIDLQSKFNREIPIMGISLLNFDGRGMNMVIIKEKKKICTHSNS